MKLIIFKVLSDWAEECFDKSKRGFWQGRTLALFLKNSKTKTLPPQKILFLFYVIKLKYLAIISKEVKMRVFKKFIITLMVTCCMFVIAGCEDATQIRCASISEITSAGSDNYGVRISYQADSRLEGKGTDIQVKFSKIGTYTFWEENDQKLEFVITEMDEWFSMTSLICKAKGREGEEEFEELKEAKSKFYLFNFEGKSEITLRVVAGQKEENINRTGEILVGSEPISSQFTLKIK